MSVPPKYRPNQLSEEVKTYVVIDVHNRAREWTCNLKKEFVSISPDTPAFSIGENSVSMPPEVPAFIITDDGGIVQLLYIVSIDDLESFMAGEEEDDAEE